MLSNKKAAVAIMGASIIAYIAGAGTVKYKPEPQQIQQTETAVRSETKTPETKKNQINEKLADIDAVLAGRAMYPIDQSKVEDALCKGYMNASNDKYSEYYTEKEYKLLTEETNGRYYGIGAMLSMDKAGELPYIVKVFPGSPAEAGGLLAGDRIVSVDAHDAQGQDLDAFVASYIRGEDKTPITIKVIRDTETLELSVSRDRVDIPTVEFETRDDHIGVLTISQFSDISVSQFKKAMESFEKEKADGIIIDLRDNPGGALYAATDMLEYALPDGPLLYLKDSSGTEEETSGNDGHEVDIPTVILTNGNTASASEIFVSAYKDYKKATIIGTTTYGKGVAQYVFPVGDGSAVKFTAQEFYTKNKKKIDGKGITPDIIVEAGDGEDDPQMEKAIEFLKGEKT